MQDLGFFSFLLCMVGFEVQMRLIAGGTQLQRTRILSGDSRSDETERHSSTLLLAGCCDENPGFEGQQVGRQEPPTCGSDSRSMDRTKKWPWNCDMLSPLLHLTRITPSQPVTAMTFMLKRFTVLSTHRQACTN